MPRGDGTGPMGTGPRSGRTGYCRAGYLNAPNRGAAGFGRGRGAGWCRWDQGRPWGSGYAGPPAQGTGQVEVVSPPATGSSGELEALQKENQTLRSELERIQQRISELETRAIEAS